MQALTLACPEAARCAAQALAVCSAQLLPDQAQQSAWQVQQASGMLRGRLLLGWLLQSLGSRRRAEPARHAR
jgi:hypothetical protein